MSDKTLSPQPGWSKPKPRVIAEPTIWPAATALGAVGLALGILTSPIISGAGAALFAAALAGWIGDLRHEQREHPPRA